MAELKACPFCGNNQAYMHTDVEINVHYVKCPQCDCEGPSAYTEVEAVTAWNTRHAPELEEAVSGLEMFFPRPGENANDSYERVASVFQSETGYLRPGKSYPAVAPAPEDRQQVWEDWYEAKVSAARSILSSLGRLT